MKCLWIALAVARVVPAADFAVQEYLPPDTKVVMGVRVRGLADSPLFQQSADGAKAVKESWTKLSTFAGFDPLHDIDEVLLTSPADRENAPALLVVRGRFKVEQWSEHAERYHGAAIFGSHEKGANSVVALLDENTALVGEVPTVRAAIDRRGKPAAYDGALLARVMSLRERFDIWGTGERPQGFVAPGGPSDQLNSIDRFEFGVGVAHGIELSGEIHARSPEDVEKLAGSLAMLQMMAKSQSNAANFDVKVEESTLRLSFSISEEELKKALAAHKAETTAPKVVGQPAAPVHQQVTTPGGTSVMTLPGKRQ
jgi:hypothetical protein